MLPALIHAVAKPSKCLAVGSTPGPVTAFSSDLTHKCAVTLLDTPTLTVIVVDVIAVIALNVPAAGSVVLG